MKEGINLYISSKNPLLLCTITAEHQFLTAPEGRWKLGAKQFSSVMAKGFVGRHGSKMFHSLVKPQLRMCFKHQFSGNRHQKRDFGEINNSNI